MNIYEIFLPTRSLWGADMPEASFSYEVMGTLAAALISSNFEFKSQQRNATLKFAIINILTFSSIMAHKHMLTAS